MITFNCRIQSLGWDEHCRDLHRFKNLSALLRVKENSEEDREQLKMFV